MKKVITGSVLALALFLGGCIPSMFQSGALSSCTECFTDIQSAQVETDTENKLNKFLEQQGVKLEE